MDTIKFAIEETLIEGACCSIPTINIYINDVNLIHLVDQVEHGYCDPFSKSGSVSQSYVGLPPEYYRGFRQEFLGQSGRPFSILLTCTCLEEMCNSIVGRIVFTEKKVTWSDIHSPFLAREAEKWLTLEGYPIDYSSLGPFVFDRVHYMDALDAVETAG